MKTTSTLLKGWALLCTLLVSLAFSTSVMAEEDLFSIYCPADVTVDCQDELWDLSIYGNAYYHDYNGNHDAGTPYINYNLSSCNVGTIVRTWTIEDPNWNLQSCSQTITVNATGGFNEYNIHWPEPYIELTGCNPAYQPENLPYGYGYPTYDYADCSLIGVSHSDQVFTISPQCTKILRTYKVMDWCTFTGIEGPHSSGLYTFVQTIKISKSDLPEVEFADEIEFNSYNCGGRHLDIPPLYVPPSTCGGDFYISNNSPYADNNGADISGTYPIGTTKVVFTVRYGCTGKVYHTVDIVVKDAGGPLPYCIAELTTTLMPMDDNNDGIADNGMVEIWAKDLDFGSSSPCGHGPVQFSFSPDVADKFKVFTCDNVGDNIINMYVTDTKGNQSYCQVNVIIQNNNANIPDCQPNIDPDAYNVAGMIMMSSQERVANANVSLISTAPISDQWVGWNEVDQLVTEQYLDEHGYWQERSRYEKVQVYGNHETVHFGEATATTDINGNYTIDNAVRSDVEYMVTAAYDANDNSVNYADVKALLYHLQGKELLTTAYQFLAADLDQDGDIDFNDLSELLQYSNGISDSFSSGKHWVMVDASYTFSDPAEIIEGNCPEAVYFTVNGSNINSKNFIAVRLGDLTEEELIMVNSNQNLQNLRNVNTGNLDSEDIETIARSLVGVSATVSAYPNPFSESFVVTYDAEITEDITIEITDITGRSISKKQYKAALGNNKYTLAINQPTGIYLCNIKGLNLNESIKLIKE